MLRGRPMGEEYDKLWQHILDDLRRQDVADGDSDALAARDLQLLEAVRPWLNVGQIMVSRGNQKYFDLLQSRYPIGFNRIDWRFVQPHETVDVLSMQDRHTVQASEELARLKDARSVVEAWLLKSPTSATDPILWIGDACDLVLDTTQPVFLECFPQLFGIGQHSYVIPRSCEWCINYILEGELFWGCSSDSLMTGCVDLDSM
jgi:hypothetical protein